MVVKIIIFLFLLVGCQSFEHELFLDYLNYNQINRALIVHCDNFLWKNVQQYMGFFSEKFVSFFNMNLKEADDIKLFFPNCNPRIGIYFDLNCNAALDVLHAAERIELFNSSLVWLITSGSMALANSTLSQIKLNVATELTLAIKATNKKTYLYEAYNLCSYCGFTPSINETGYWTKDSGIITHLNFMQISKVIRRSDFRGITIRASTPILRLPKGMTVLEHLESLEHRHLNIMQREGYNIFKLVAEKLNFKMLITRTRAFGKYNNGTWSGSIRELVRHDAEFAITPLKMDLNRVGAFVSLPEFYSTKLLFIFRHPTESGLRNMFLNPFHEGVWWCTLIICIVIIFLLRFMGWFNLEKSVASLSREFLTITGVIFQQGYEDSYPSISSRTVLLTSMVFAIILFQFYSAFIVGSLLTEPPRTITTIDKLFNSKLRIGMEDIIYNHDLFNMTSKEAKRLFDWKMSKNIVPFSEGMQLIKRGGFAFHVEISSAYNVLQDILTESEICDLQEVSFFGKFQTFTAIVKGSPFKEYMANIILRIREFGLLDYITKQWQPNKPKCRFRNTVKTVPIDLEQFLPAIIGLGFGFIFSLIILIGEIIYFKVTSMIKKPK